MTTILSDAERRARNRRKAAKREQRLRARTLDQVREVQGRLFPDGHAECRRCGVRRPLSEFPATRSRLAGIVPYCANGCFSAPEGERPHASHDEQRASVGTIPEVVFRAAFEAADD